MQHPQHNTLSQQILDFTRRLGLTGGARLPSERRLAQRLECSRNSVREALCALVAQGVIEVRPRSGAYLRAAPASWPKDGQPSALSVAAEALCVVAPMLAAFSCTQCGEPELARLEASTMQMGQALVDKNILNVWLGLSAFYRELAVICGNPLVLRFVEELADPERTRVADGNASAIPDGELQPFFSAHIELLQAVRSGDAEAGAAQAANSTGAFKRFLARPQTLPGADEAARQAG